jgi:hypothetical protein
MVLGFNELPARVSPTREQRQTFPFSDQGPVGSITIGLEFAGERFQELPRSLPRPPGLPIEKDVRPRSAVDPEVTAATAAMLLAVQIADRRFIGLDVKSLEQVGLHLPVDRLQPGRHVLGPVDHRLPGDRNPMPLAEDLFHAVEGQMVFKTTEDQVRQQPDSGQALLHQSLRQCGNQHLLLIQHLGGHPGRQLHHRCRLGFAHELGPDIVTPEKAARLVVQLTGDFLVNLSKGLGMGLHFGMARERILAELLLDPGA